MSLSEKQEKALLDAAKRHCALCIAEAGKWSTHSSHAEMIAAYERTLEEKPEPKRGVEHKPNTAAILMAVAEQLRLGMNLTFSQMEALAGELDCALRLYREERERLAAEIRETITAQWAVQHGKDSYGEGLHPSEIDKRMRRWADELERRDG